MTTMLIAQNSTVESGSFGGDQLCALKAAYMMVANQPDVDRVIMTMSPQNSLGFVWQKFIDTHKVEVVWDDWNPGDWTARFAAWDKWRAERRISDKNLAGLSGTFDHYRELYLRIHGYQRQTLICGLERGLGRRNIYEYWCAGQENCPDTFPGSDWYDDTLCYHQEPRAPDRDVYISPHCKTQGNHVFTFGFWAAVCKRLLDAGVTVTVGYDGYFAHDLDGHPQFKRYWGNHAEWFAEVQRHRIVACGNTGTGWVAAACGVPMVSVEPPNSQMPDHRYRECGLRNLVEVVDEDKLHELGFDVEGRVAEYVARRLIDQVQRRVVMTTGCYDVLHAGHVRHLERARAMGTRLVVALNSDRSVRALKGPTRPINPEGQRKAVLEALRCVDEVRLFDGPDAIPLMCELRPAVLACGYGYTPDTIVGCDLVEGWGGRVVVTCAGDASDEPSTTKIVQRMMRSADVAEVCRLGTAYSVNPYDKLRLLADEFLKVAHLLGDVADLGAYRGGSALVLRRLAPDKHLHLFDTWRGTPHDDPLCHHKKGEWAAPLADCQKVVGTDEKTHYWVGEFGQVMELSEAGVCTQAIPHTYCFVYIDMDTYQSTRDALEFFWPRLVQGGRMVVDDYGWEPCAGVKKAVDEWLNECVDAPSRVIQYQSLHTWIAEKR